jgi:hypothetical protein
MTNMTTTDPPGMTDLDQIRGRHNRDQRVLSRAVRATLRDSGFTIGGPQTGLVANRNLAVTVHPPRRR